MYTCINICIGMYKNLIYKRYICGAIPASSPLLRRGEKHSSGVLYGAAPDPSAPQPHMYQPGTPTYTRNKHIQRKYKKLKNINTIY
jgi:hypothetical protein